MTAIGMGYNKAAAQAPTARALVDGDVKAKFLGKLLNYIPGDVVAGYVAVVALADSSNDDWRPEWQIAWAFLAASVFLVLVTFLAKWRTDHDGWPSRGELPWFRIVVAPVAFAAWVYSLPSSPFQDWGEIADYSKTLVMVVASLGLAGLGMVIEPNEV